MHGVLRKKTTDIQLPMGHIYTGQLVISVDPTDLFILVLIIINSNTLKIS